MNNVIRTVPGTQESATIEHLNNLIAMYRRAKSEKGRRTVHVRINKIRDFMGIPRTFIK